VARPASKRGWARQGIAMLMTGSYCTTEAYPGNRRADAWKDALGHLSLKVNRIEDDGRLHASARSIVSPMGIFFARNARSIDARLALRNGI